jgi:hypothetical protein
MTETVPVSKASLLWDGPFSVNLPHQFIFISFLSLSRNKFRCLRSSKASTFKDRVEDVERLSYFVHPPGSQLALAAGLIHPCVLVVQGKDLNSSEQSDNRVRPRLQFRVIG